MAPDLGPQHWKEGFTKEKESLSLFYTTSLFTMSKRKRSNTVLMVSRPEDCVDRRRNNIMSRVWVQIYVVVRVKSANRIWIKMRQG